MTKAYKITSMQRVKTVCQFRILYYGNHHSIHYRAFQSFTVRYWFKIGAVYNKKNKSTPLISMGISPFSVDFFGIFGFIYVLHNAVFKRAIINTIIKGR